MSKIDPNERRRMREHVRRAYSKGVAPDDLPYYPQQETETDHETGLPQKPEDMAWDEWMEGHITLEELNQYTDRVADGLTPIDDEDDDEDVGEALLC